MCRSERLLANSLACSFVVSIAIQARGKRAISGKPKGTET